MSAHFPGLRHQGVIDVNGDAHMATFRYGVPAIHISTPCLLSR
jgi:hypothetical protein